MPIEKDHDQPEHKTNKSTFKIVTIAVSAVLVTAALMAATGSFAGIIAYGQNTDDSDMTAFEEEANASEETTTATSNDTSSQTDETTFTASAVADSTCAPVMTAADGAASFDTATSSSNTTGGASTDDLDLGVSGNETSSATNASDDTFNVTATAGTTTGLNDTQIATLDALIESACEAIRDEQSVTALGFLSSAQDILNDMQAESQTEAAALTEEEEVEDEDEPNDVDVEGNIEDEDELGEDAENESE